MDDKIEKDRNQNPTDSENNYILKQQNEIFKEEIKNLREIIDKLSNEISELKRKNIPDKIYETDEEDLERETNWILHENIKKQKRLAKKPKIEAHAECSKRKAESSPELATSPIKTTTVNEKKSKAQMPPPINITQVDSFHVIKNILKEATNGDYRLTSMNNNVWKVNMPDTESYRSLATVLNAKNMEWYTYEDKNSKPIRIVARGLHPSCLPNEILEDLTSKNLKIIEATNMYRVEKTVNSKGERSVVKKCSPYSL